mmetsp:Transcript_38816/g.91283  ORF Transcript_38816/g.91283 Transcript_38816/m.91283 type:complete len:129 (+) Transcript_38816:142-528(+)
MGCTQSSQAKAADQPKAAEAPPKAEESTASPADGKEDAGKTQNEEPPQAQADTAEPTAADEVKNGQATTSVEAETTASDEAHSQEKRAGDGGAVIVEVAATGASQGSAVQERGLFAWCCASPAETAAN